MNALAPISYEASLKAHYAAARGRIFAAGMRAETKKNEVVRLQSQPIVTAWLKPEKEDDPPEWSIERIRFDAHVIGYMVHLAKCASPKRAYLISRAMEFGFTVAEILSPTLKRHVVHTRQDIMLEIKERWPETSLPQMGRLFGGLDHTTILHGLRQAAKRRAAKEMKRDDA